jgi:hypothetical protein
MELGNTFTSFRDRTDVGAFGVVPLSRERGVVKPHAGELPLH